jgi:hypothetical protein
MGAAIVSNLDATRENVPYELRAISRWVAWRRFGRAKVPVDDRGRKLRDWQKKAMTFEEAVETADALPDAGVGFVFADGDDVAGVDLDCCRDPSTGEVEAWARKVVDIFDSYAEVSPSGTGVKILAGGAAAIAKAGSDPDLTPVRLSKTRPDDDLTILTVLTIGRDRPRACRGKGVQISGTFEMRTGGAAPRIFSSNSESFFPGPGGIESLQLCMPDRWGSGAFRREIGGTSFFRAPRLRSAPLENRREIQVGGGSLGCP